jgi:hypothetical protein
MASQHVAGEEGGGVARPGGSSGSELARSRVRAEVFCQWPVRLDSAGVFACKTTGHARRRTDDRLGSFLQVRAYAKQRTTRKQRCVGRGSSTREQENPRVRGEVGIANPFGSIVSSHNPRHPIVLTLVDRSTAITTNHHGDYSFGHLSPAATLPGKLLRHPRNLVTVKYFSSSILFATGIHFPFVLLHNQGYPKVCHDPLNLPSADDFLRRDAVVFCLFFVFPD